ncbi:MAG TPA: hypothetical protein VGB25_10695 [Candidatus Binatia bacterium]
MAGITVAQVFPAGRLQDIDGLWVEFPAIFSRSPASVAFFYRGRF